MNIIDPSLAESHSAEAVQASAVAQEAIEKARLAQMKLALSESLKDVFGGSDDPAQMKVLVRRIPILCTNIEAMHQAIEDIQSNLRWAVRIVLGAVILGALKFFLRL